MNLKRGMTVMALWSNQCVWCQIICLKDMNICRNILRILME